MDTLPCVIMICDLSLVVLVFSENLKHWWMANNEVSDFASSASSVMQYIYIYIYIYCSEEIDL